MKAVATTFTIVVLMCVGLLVTSRMLTNLNIALEENYKIYLHMFR